MTEPITKSRINIKFNICACEYFGLPAGSVDGKSGDSSPSMRRRNFWSEILTLDGLGNNDLPYFSLTD